MGYIHEGNRILNFVKGYTESDKQVTYIYVEQPLVFLYLTPAITCTYTHKSPHIDTLFQEFNTSLSTQTDPFHSLFFTFGKRFVKRKNEVLHVSSQSLQGECRFT